MRIPTEDLNPWPIALTLTTTRLTPHSKINLILALILTLDANPAAGGQNNRNTCRTTTVEACDVKVLRVCHRDTDSPLWLFF